MIKAIVPLKLTLFGEHAVVYGRPAIAFTISEHLAVTVKDSDEFLIKSDELPIKGVKVNLRDFKIENERIKGLLAYVIEAIKYFGEEKKAEISIESSVEPSVGLGTSAAVTVGTVAAYSAFLGKKLSKEEIAKISHEVELRVQGIASKMDTHTEALGGFVYFDERGGLQQLGRVNISFSAGYFRRFMTTAEMLKRVRKLKEKYSKLFDNLLDEIAEITKMGKEALIRSDEDEVGYLMYLNHGLLFSLGVTAPVLDNFVSTAKLMGIKGCKMSGGGAGGAVVCTRDDRVNVLMDVMGARRINAEPTFTGVQIFSED
ncbi:MAG: mevalonate kinase [Sulfolobaceae archaeon]|nr:mevalonate kinase [Sulfolobaceae archaeon]